MAQPYQRTVAEPMVEASAQLEYPTSRGEVLAWFADNYPDVKLSTVRAHIVGLTANDRNRHHYPSLARREPLFTRHPDGSLTGFQDSEDGGQDEGQDETEDLDLATAPPLEFALEAFLEEFVLTNWEGIDWGRPLELWESETNELGHQLATPVGRLDFLCRDTATGALVVVELKRGPRTESWAKSQGTWVGFEPVWRGRTNQLRASSSPTTRISSSRTP
jgi:hypothetical protein